MSSLTVTIKKGKEIEDLIEDFAKLRIKIFQDYPYLYEGNLESEMRYLKKYFNCSESITVCVQDKEKLVGVSTAMPLQFEHNETIKPFQKGNYNIEDVFYFSESVLLHEFRANNIYPVFFEEREKAARNYGSKYASFCCVIRSENHPRKPQNYKNLSSAWINAGFDKEPNLTTEFSCKEIGDKVETSNKMQFWIKNLT